MHCSVSSKAREIKRDSAARVILECETIQCSAQDADEMFTNSPLGGSSQVERTKETLI